MQEKYRVLFEPGRIAGVPLKNRFYMAPIGPSGMCDAEGAFTETAVEYYAVRARGGVGLIITGDCFVENEIQPCVMPSHVVPTLRPTCFIRSAKRLTERVHAYGTKIFIQLSAGFGRVGHASNVSGDVIAPSPVEHRWIKGLMCREMTVEEIHTFVRKFGEAAAHAKKAGFDGVEIHAIHEGYLLDQFTLALFNKRTDAYGGSLENRLRFAMEIVQEIKRVCGADFPVGVRYSPKSFVRDMNEKAGGLPGQEFEELGRDMDEGLTVAKMLQDAGYDFLDADVGSYESWHWSHPPMYHQKGMYLPYVSQLKKVVEIPVMCAGRMDNPDISSAALAGGKIDFVGLARPLLADPDYVEKLRRNQLERIRPCLSCQEACMGRIQKFSSVCCAVNPAVGREVAYAVGRAQERKKVLVVGGGLVGCELALWLRKQDSTREVTLVEALPDVLMVGTPVCDANTDMLKALLPFHGVKEELGARVVRTEPDGVVLHLCDGSEQKLEADTIAVAVGYRSENRLFQELQGLDAQLFQIGDANKVANIHYAIWDAYEVARGI